jgi:hypothetical protein
VAFWWKGGDVRRTTLILQSKYINTDIWTAIMSTFMLSALSHGANSQELHGMAAITQPGRFHMLSVGSLGCAALSGCISNTYSVAGGPIPYFKVYTPPPAALQWNAHLNAAAAIPLGTTWAVGDMSAAGDRGQTFRTLTMQWSGQKWSPAASPNYNDPNSAPGTTDNSLTGVAGVLDQDVWAVGWAGSPGTSAQQPLILHWDGVIWSLSPHPPNEISPEWANVLTAVTAISSTEAWAVGWRQDPAISQCTFVYRWDGTNWTVVQAVDPGASKDIFYGVSGIAPDDVWAVGTASGVKGQLASQSNLIEHWNGSVWQVIASPNVLRKPGATNELYAVHEIAKNNVWAIGCAQSQAKRVSSILHWDGSHWAAQLGPAGCLYSITARSPQEIWAAGERSNNHTLVLRSDGKTWQIVSSP